MYTETATMRYPTIAFLFILDVSVNKNDGLPWTEERVGCDAIKFNW